MNDEIKKYLLENKQDIVERKNEREEEERQEYSKVITSSEQKTSTYNTLIFNLFKIGYLYDEARTDNTNLFHIAIEDNTLPKDASTSSKQSDTSSIFDVALPGDFLEDNDYLDEEIPQTKKDKTYILTIDGFIPNSLKDIEKLDDEKKNKVNECITKIVEMICKYNKKNTDTKIMILPCKSGIYYFIFKINDIKLLGFDVNTECTKTVISITKEKLEKLMDELANEKDHNQNIPLSDLEPLIDLHEKLQEKDELIKTYNEKCKENFNKIAKEIYEEFINDYKENYKSIDETVDFEFELDYLETTTLLPYKDSIEYAYYKLFTKDNPKDIVFVRKHYMYISSNNGFMPIFKSDLGELRNDLDAELSLTENKGLEKKYLKITVNSLKFEDLITSLLNDNNRQK